MPIMYWEKVHATGNFAYLEISDSIHIEKKMPTGMRKHALQIMWRQMIDQYIARFGFSESFLEIFRKEKEVVSLKLQRIANSDKTLNAFIGIAEAELSQIKEQSKSGSFDALLAAVDKFMGYSIDPMRCSVSKFYSYVAMMDRQNKLANNR